MIRTLRCLSSLRLNHSSSQSHQKVRCIFSFSKQSCDLSYPICLFMLRDPFQCELLEAQKWQLHNKPRPPLCISKKFHNTSSAHSSFEKATADSSLGKTDVDSWDQAAVGSCPKREGLLPERRDYFDRVLASLPVKQRALALAYGSGVFEQAGKSWTKNSMTDFIFVVDSPEEWHRENIERNPSHYSPILRWMGAKAVSKLQTDCGAKVYFNTLVPFEDGLIKYGVISTHHFIEDLTDWKTLYVAGRLHKPVNLLEVSRTNQKLHNSLKVNLKSAVHAALLVLPASFTPRDLYLALAGISYMGDLRMIVGEDKNKVQNIVDGQIHLFRKLYQSNILKMAPFLQSTSSGYLQDCSWRSRHHHLIHLPQHLQQRIVHQFNQSGAVNSLDQVMELAAEEAEQKRVARFLQEGIAGIVKGPSSSQALKGIVTAGPFKATQYSRAKLAKMFKSLKNS